MKKWIWLLAVWVMVQDTVTKRYSCEERFDELQGSYVSEDVCLDYAEAINEAHERRTNRYEHHVTTANFNTGRIYIGPGTLVPCLPNDTSCINGVRSDVVY